MSGSNAICVATVLLDTGIIPMQEPETEIILEAPAGLVTVRAECKNGKAQRISIQNVPAFVGSLDQNLFVKVRSTSALLKAEILLKKNSYLINLEKGEYGISPGQACVFYSKNIEGYKVLGGGWVKK